MVTNSYDVETQLLVEDLVYNSEIPLAESEFLLTGELFASCGVCVICEASNLFNDPNSVLLFDFFDLLRRK